MDKIWLNLDWGPLGNNRSCQKLVHIVVSASEVLVVSLGFEGHYTDTSLLRLGSAHPLAMVRSPLSLPRSQRGIHLPWAVPGVIDPGLMALVIFLDISYRLFIWDAAFKMKNGINLYNTGLLKPTTVIMTICQEKTNMPLDSLISFSLSKKLSRKFR